MKLFAEAKFTVVEYSAPTSNNTPIEEAERKGLTIVPAFILKKS
jgi:hypothetical protein